MCVRQRAQEYAKTHREQRKAYQKRWVENNREYINAKKRAYYQANPRRHHESQYKWNRKNYERLIQYWKTWRKQNPEKVAQYGRSWRRRNPEKVRKQWLRGDSIRRARKLNASGSFTATDIDIQYQKQGGLCWWCGKELHNKYHIDHVIPLSRGGSNYPENLVCACAHCNLSKGSKLPGEWQGKSN